MSYPERPWERRNGARVLVTSSALQQATSTGLRPPELRRETPSVGYYPSIGSVLGSRSDTAASHPSSSATLGSPFEYQPHSQSLPQPRSSRVRTGTDQDAFHPQTHYPHTYAQDTSPVPGLDAPFQYDPRPDRPEPRSTWASTTSPHNHRGRRTSTHRARTPPRRRSPPPRPTRRDREYHRGDDSFSSLYRDDDGTRGGGAGMSRSPYYDRRTRTPPMQLFQTSYGDSGRGSGYYRSGGHGGGGFGDGDDDTLPGSGYTDAGF